MKQEKKWFQEKPNGLIRITLERNGKKAGIDIPARLLEKAIPEWVYKVDNEIAGEYVRELYDEVMKDKK